MKRMSESFSKPLQRTYEGLCGISPALAERYARTAEQVQTMLTPADQAHWAARCLRLAQSGWRAWECAEQWLRLSPFLVQRLDLAAVWDWIDQGTVLAERSAEVATAFLQAARPLLRQASQTVFEPWVVGGRWYVDQFPTRPNLAAEYFRVSPAVYGHFPLRVCALWQQLGHTLTQADPKHGQTFFALSRTLLDTVDGNDLAPAWEVARDIAPHSPEVALHYLERYPDLLEHLGADPLRHVEAILRLLLAPKATAAGTFLRLVVGTLSFASPTERTQALEWCQEIAAVSPAGVLELLRHLPDLMRRLPGKRLQPWITTGIEVAQRHAEAGQAYFALESATAQNRLRTLQKLVTFTEVDRILRLYTEALVGQRLDLRTVEALPGTQRAGDSSLPTTNGRTIFVPEQVDALASEHDNFAVYKVAILHQVGFYEDGTYTFSMPELRRRVPGIDQRLATLGGSPQHDVATAFERFFARFAEPELARRLFTILEDARIDASLARRYRGIRQDLATVMQHSLAQRPALDGMPLRQALLEGLLQATLGGMPSDRLPPGFRVLLRLLGQRLQPLHAEGTTVYDTASAVVDCYRLMTEIPARAAALSAAMAAQLEDMMADLTDDADLMNLAEMFRQAGEGVDSMPMLPESTEPAEGIEPVPYRGEVKPELIQKQLRIQELTDELQRMNDPTSPLPPEVLKELLERGEIDITSLQEGDLDATSGLFVSDLEGRQGGLGFEEADRQAELQQELEALQSNLGEAYDDELAGQGQAVVYDEWDYLIGDYRRRWCRLTETLLDEDDTAFVEETKHKHADLLTAVRQQFQMLKPEMFKKLKRLVDGEDIDLDSAIEAIVDRRAGNVQPEKVYMRRNKRDRSVAALFLLDMSASTDDEVTEPEDAAAPVPEAPQPRRFDFSGFVRDDYYAPPRQAEPDKPKRRIIDVEKEAMVLMAEALEALGDEYAIYGFSGYGRDQVEVFVAKAFADRYDERVQGRIAAIKPHRSTRMGPAIRHAIRKLEQQDARIKTLLLLSDGYPQDFDYGKDRKSKDYGIQDTMMALHEAHLKGIQTFCITVDPAGHDYLRDMCPDQNYLVLEEVASLPNELPKIYRGLTT
jgi:nitric oxide reductase NorD protein